jgi:glycerol-3-phosphate acyltransferase PlsX
MDDKPSQALRHGRWKSSMCGHRRGKKGEADVVVSAGNTGALMAMAAHLKMKEGIERPHCCARQR